MRIKVAADDPQSMSQSGDAILASLQDRELSTTDLIVRESLQNALDASLEKSSQTLVEYTLGNFEAEKLNNQFEDIDESLTKKYRGETEFLAISDKFTTGLTGDYRTTDSSKLNKSNFQKLVFGINKKQQADGAGGSWGLGKTSYFRVGNGIVIYYTRIATDNGYEERLIASLIEDPNSSDKLLESSNRGIAWWGKYEKDSGMLFPITDSNEIRKFLEIFGLSPYTDDITGTTIIIPYLKPYVASDENIPWQRNRERDIRTAVKRWYSPRLYNKEYAKFVKQPMLACKINGSVINDQNMESIFKIFRNLYTSALTGKGVDKSIKVKKIFIPRQGMVDAQTPIGNVAYTILKKDVVSDGDWTPKTYLSNSGDDSINPTRILAFTRKPGMIVRYDFDGTWTKGVKVPEGMIMLAFFVPNSEGDLHKDFQEKGFVKLEQYLRASEKADHADWGNINGIRWKLYTRIVKYVSETLCGETKDDSEKDDSFLSAGLARKYGTKFLPPNSYGKASKTIQNSKSRKKHDKKHKRTAELRLRDSVMQADGNIKVNFIVSLKGEAKIELKIKTQDSNINFANWHSNFEGLEFPVKIKAIVFEDEKININEQNAATVTINRESGTGEESKGYLILQLSSNEYQPQISIQQVRGESNARN